MLHLLSKSVRPAVIMFNLLFASVGTNVDTVCAFKDFQ